jgi:hypothetical protein
MPLMSACAGFQYLPVKRTTNGLISITITNAAIPRKKSSIYCGIRIKILTTNPKTKNAYNLFGSFISVAEICGYECAGCVIDFLSIHLG